MLLSAMQSIWKGILSSWGTCMEAWSTPSMLLILSRSKWLLRDSPNPSIPSIQCWAKYCSKLWCIFSWCQKKYFPKSEDGPPNDSRLPSQTAWVLLTAILGRDNVVDYRFCSEMVCKYGLYAEPYFYGIFFNGNRLRRPSRGDVGQAPPRWAWGTALWQRPQNWKGLR